MNLRALEQKLWGVLGLHQAGSRYNWRRQQIRDALNTTLDEMTQYAFSRHRLVAERTLAIVAGQSVYTLNDWTRFPLKFWTQDQNSHRVEQITLDHAIRDGLLNSNAVYGTLGPYELRAYPPTESPAKSGTAAATTEGDETVTKTGGSDWTSDDLGRMLRLNGEPEDYLVSSINSVTSLEADKKFRGRLDGEAQEDTAGVASNYANVKWEVGPPGRFRIQIVPTPTAAATLYYADCRHPRRLVRDDDVAELSDGYHDALWKGALRLVDLGNLDVPGYQGWADEYERALQRLKDADRAEWQTSSTPRILMRDAYANRRAFQPGTYFRGEEDW